MDLKKLMVIIHGWPSKCENKPFHAKKRVNNYGFRKYCISHQVSNSQMKSSSSMVLTIPKYWRGPLEVPYMSSMSHNNNVIYFFKHKSIFESKESSSTNITTGMGGLNLTPYLVNTLMNLFLVSEAWMLFMVNPNPNMGKQP
jgi:hypothetical protein